MDELKENLKTLLRKAINNVKDGDEKGKWITIKGTHVFIPEGKTAEDVIKEKGWEEKGEDEEKTDKDDTSDKDPIEDWQERLDRIAEEVDFYDEKKSDEPKQEEKKDKFRYEGKTKQITKDEWDKTPNDYKLTKDGKKYIMYIDDETHSTVLGRAEIIGEEKATKYFSKFSDIQNLVGTIKPGEEYFESKVRTAEKRLKDKLEAWEKDYEKETKPAVKQMKKRNIEVVKDELEKLNKLKSIANDKEQSVKNGLSEIIKNCKPETKEDLKILKGLKDILEEQ